MTGSWSSGGNLNTARPYLAGAGTQSAGLCMGGYASGYSNITEEYNGTSWSSGGNLNTARRSPAGAGTQSAGLCIGGYDGNSKNITEEYNGTSWSSGGNLNTARYELASCGTQSAGLCMGGYISSYSNVTEEYNGTSWSSGGNLNTAKHELASCGTQSAGLCMGGTTGSISNVTEEYNGTSWSSGGNLNTARRGLAGAGTQSAGLCMGGTTGSISNVTEEYNGTSWSNVDNLSTARLYLAGAGTQSAGLCMGGYASGDSNITEEYSIPDFFEIRYIKGSTTNKHFTDYLIDFTLEKELEEMLDKLDLLISRRIADEAWFDGFDPDVEILLQYGSTPIFRGRVKDRDLKHGYNVEIYSSAEINGRKVANTVYNDQSPESIFSNLISTYTDLTPQTPTASGTIIDRFVATEYVDSLIKKLAEILDWQIWSDAEKNIYLEPRGNTTNSNTIYRQKVSAKDLSDESNDGTIYGAIGTKGKIGSALYFDGVDDYVDCGNDSSLSSISKTGSYTFETWIYSIDDDYSQQAAIFEKSPSNDNRNGMTHRSGSIRFGYYDGSNWSGASGSLTKNQWGHVVGINDEGVLSLYINGVLATGTTEPYISVSIDLLLGKTSLAGSEHTFNGIIDEVCIYSRALESTEVTDHYNSGNGKVLIPADESGLVSYWRFEPKHNALFGKWKEFHNELANRVIIVGDKVQYNTSELFSGDDSTTSFTLTEIPINIIVYISDVEQDKDTYSIVATDRIVTFNTAPTTGSENMKIEYTYSYPIYCDKKDQTSIDTYGEFVKKMWLTWIKSRKDAINYALEYIGAYKDPLKKNTLILPIKQLVTYNVGEEVNIDDDLESIDDNFIIHKIIGKYSKGYMEMQVGNDIPTFSTSQGMIMNRIKELEKSNDIVAQLYESPGESITITETFDDSDTDYLNHKVYLTYPTRCNYGRGTSYDARVGLCRVK